MLEIIKKIICCPSCGSDLEINSSIVCTACSWSEENTDFNIDFKLKHPKTITFEQELGSNVNSFNKAKNDGVYKFKFGFEKT